MTLEKIRKKMEYLNIQYIPEKLSEMIEEAVKEEKTQIEFLDEILKYEVESREEKRIATSLKLSGLPKGMTLDNFDYMFQPAIRREEIEYLSTSEYIREHKNILLFGPPGVGKTHIATGLGVKAVELGYSVSYFTAEELLHTLKKRSATPVQKQKRHNYIKNSMIIVDELGYQRLDRDETHMFFQLVSARYMKGSMVITSNRSVREWVQIFADDQMATTAILDRLFHRAHIFNIDGNSYRLKDFEMTLKHKSKGL
jgi:DNA replication protein DnaC